MIKANAQKRRKLSTISSVTVGTPHKDGPPPPTRGRLRERYRFKEELLQLFNSVANTNHILLSSNLQQGPVIMGEMSTEL